LFPLSSVSPQPYERLFPFGARELLLTVITHGGTSTTPLQECRYVVRDDAPPSSSRIYGIKHDLGCITVRPYFLFLLSLGSNLLHDGGGGR
jgi:hypothetical protein